MSTNRYPKYACMDIKTKETYESSFKTKYNMNN